MHTQDIVNDNVKRLAELFPECITEVTTDDDKAVKKVIDFSILNQLLSGNTVNYSENGGGDTERTISVYVAR